MYENASFILSPYMHEEVEYYKRKINDSSRSINKYNYLKYHDELPFDLEINCLLEEELIPLNIETRLIRPMNTKPCGNLFRIKEDDIFIDNNNSLYKYYQICPHCGYIVNIPEEILSDTIKNVLIIDIVKILYYLEKCFYIQNLLV